MSNQTARSGSKTFPIDHPPDPTIPYSLFTIPYFRSTPPVFPRTFQLGSGVPVGQTAERGARRRVFERSRGCPVRERNARLKAAFRWTGGVVHRPSTAWTDPRIRLHRGWLSAEKGVVQGGGKAPRRIDSKYGVVRTPTTCAARAPCCGPTDEPARHRYSGSAAFCVCIRGVWGVLETPAPLGKGWVQITRGRQSTVSTVTP